jgi:phosphorylcholine metabolism protein LicD
VCGGCAGNIIPWDYDVDTCMRKKDFKKLLEVFAKSNNIIGSLKLVPDYYNDGGCAAIIDNDIYGDAALIDVEVRSPARVVCIRFFFMRQLF